jgi:hypothetical protein
MWGSRLQKHEKKWLLSSSLFHATTPHSALLVECDSFSRTKIFLLMLFYSLCQVYISIKIDQFLSNFLLYLPKISSSEHEAVLLIHGYLVSGRMMFL